MDWAVFNFCYVHTAFTRNHQSYHQALPVQEMRTDGLLWFSKWK